MHPISIRSTKGMAIGDVTMTEIRKVMSSAELSYYHEMLDARSKYPFKRSFIMFHSSISTHVQTLTENRK